MLWSMIETYILTYFFFSFINWIEKLRLGVVPTVNLPIKSHKVKTLAERRHIDIVQNSVASDQQAPLYKNINELVKRVKKLKLLELGVYQLEEKVYCKKMVAEYSIPKY